MARVLLVMRDEGLGPQLADHLEAEGHEVMWCPGPNAPSYVCRGGHGEHCPLTVATDVVVLDGWLESDAWRAGTPSWHLLLYYRQQGLPVVFLVGPDGLGAPVGDADVRTLSRTSSFDEIEAAVDDLIVTRVGASRIEEWS